MIVISSTIVYPEAQRHSGTRRYAGKEGIAGKGGDTENIGGTLCAKLIPYCILHLGFCMCIHYSFVILFTTCRQPMSNIKDRQFVMFSTSMVEQR